MSTDTPENENLSLVVEETNVLDQICEEITATEGKKSQAAGESSGSKDSQVHDDSIILEFEQKLAVGNVVKDPDDVFLLYCEYGRCKGFSVRKGKQEYFHSTRELYMKEFNCSCEGVKDRKCFKHETPDYQKLDTRTGCTARLRIGRKKNEEWKVTIFAIEHNHEMVAADQRYMLRSSRSISHAKGDTLMSLIRAGFSISNAYSYLENESHGRENVGFLKQDAYDYVSRLSKDHRQLEDGDVNQLVRYFKERENEDKLFYWDFQVDDNGRMCNFFFRDGRCRIDYESFGDVLSIDTTYRTNKYNLICAPFVGINHHMHNVMFGLAFISNEKEDSFCWLFNAFLESMSGKQPESIFSDQCQAMINAIEAVFPNSHHRLCQWHINQNAPSHFGSLNNDSRFKNYFHRCMEFCESEAEFEEVWCEMFAEYNLYNHSWLKKMYELRHKWSVAFSKHKFSAGLKATSRSEGTNSVLKDSGKKTHTLFECVQHFDRIQDRWRQNEKEDDFKCVNGMPTLIVSSLLLKHAAQVYTHKIYKKFEAQFLNSLGIDVDGLPINVDTLFEFKIRSQSSNRVRKVTFDMKDKEIKCSCQFFESVGILCRHALLVLKQMNVHEIPSQYIKKRWTKAVSDRVHCVEGNALPGDNESETVYANYIMRCCQNLSMRSKSHHDARALVKNGLENLTLSLNKLLENLNVDGNPMELGSSNIVNLNDDDGEHVRNPLYVKPRGITNARLANHWDSKSKKKKARVTKGSKKTSNSQTVQEERPQEASKTLMSQGAILVGYNQAWSYPVQLENDIHQNLGQSSHGGYHYRSINFSQVSSQEPRK